MTQPMRLLPLYLALLCAMLPTALAGQQLSSAAPQWAVGGAVGVPGAIGLVTVGVTGTRVAPGRIGFDFAAGTLVQALMNGRLPLGLRAGGALPVTISENTYLVPSAGVSAVMVYNESRFDSSVGLNTGLAVLFLTPGSYGFRVGLTRHAFPKVRGGLMLFEMGVVKSGPRAPADRR